MAEYKSNYTGEQIDSAIATVSALETVINSFTSIDGVSNSSYVDVPDSNITVTTGYLFNGITGKAEGNGGYAQWRYSILPVKEGENYYVKSNCGMNARLWNFLKTNDIPTDVANQANIVSRSEDSSSVSIKEDYITVPSGANYLVVNRSGETKEIIQIETTGISTEQKFDMAKSGASKSNILYGKTLVCVGDSITQGDDMEMDPLGLAEDGSYKAFGWQIAQRNNMIFHNCGIGGSTMQAIPARSGFSIANGRYTKLPDDIDFLTIMFGWNDAAAGTLGTISDTTNETYCGGFNVVMPYLIQKYPYTTIILMVPFGCTEGHRTAVRQMADKWGVACFDMCQSGTPFYYTKEGSVTVDSGIATLRRGLHQVNGAHPGYQGHHLIATELEDFMRKCGCYDRESAIFHKVSYNTSLGTKPADVEKVKVIYSTLLPTLTASGYTFGGWYTDSNLTNKANIGMILNNDIVLYAKWTASS